MLRTLDEDGDFSETPKSPSVKSVETPSKPSIDTLETSPSGTFQNFDPANPRRLWLVHDADRPRGVSFTPPVTLPEVQAAYPGAQVAPAPEPDPNPPVLPPETEAALVRWLDAIDETDVGIRAEFLLNCRRDPGGLSGILRLAADRGMVPAPPVPAPVPPAVTCGGCLHFQADEVGNGAGLGACRIGAPASRRPPALWPNAPHLCSNHEGTAP